MVVVVVADEVEVVVEKWKGRYHGIVDDKHEQRRRRNEGNA